MTVITSPKSPCFHIAIAGGGIGGLAFAIGLLRHPHISFTIYEAAAQFSEIGAGVGFGANSQAAMKLIDPAIWEGYSKRATYNGWKSKAGSWFDFTMGEKGPEEGKRIIEVLFHNDMTVSTVHRAHFLDELVRLVPEGSARFGKRLTGIDQSGEKVKMTFADGSSALADAVIGCDGVRSVCRGVVLGQDSPSTPPIFTGKVCYRGLVPMEDAIKVVGEERARNRQMYLGHGGHVITFPVGNGKVVNVAAFSTKRDGGWDGPWVQRDQKENMFKSYEGWGEMVMKILSLIESPDVWALFEHPLAPTYHNKRVCLLGDSAHTATPHFGAGAGMALEDAYVLSNLLGRCSSVSDIPYAFEAYDSVRIPRTHGVIKDSNEQGKIMGFEGTGVGDDLEKIAQKLDTTVRWIWNVDLPKDLETATKAFEEKRAAYGSDKLSPKKTSNPALTTQI